jgi:hypothetical protein
MPMAAETKRWTRYTASRTTARSIYQPARAKGTRTFSLNPIVDL